MTIEIKPFDGALPPKYLGRKPNDKYAAVLDAIVAMPKSSAIEIVAPEGTTPSQLMGSIGQYMRSNPDINPLEYTFRARAVEGSLICFRLAEPRVVKPRAPRRRGR